MPHVDPHTVRTRILKPAPAGMRGAEVDTFSLYATVGDDISIMHGGEHYDVRRIVVHDRKTGQRVLIDFDGKPESDYSFSERTMKGRE